MLPTIGNQNCDFRKGKSMNSVKSLRDFLEEEEERNG
jgi:hypothetical protein